MIGSKFIYSLNQPGGRQQNQDTLYPSNEDVSDSSRVFLVCDGVGGGNKGEVASSIVCKEFGETFEGIESAEQVDSLVEKSFERYKEKFGAYLNIFPEGNGMSTTLTMACILSDSIIFIWCGDSRLYHVRDGEILFRTKDHSLVSNLVASGEITEEEAEEHPQKNVIMRAVSSDTAIDDIDTHIITDIQDEDYILLCSDGLLECFNDKTISDLLTNENSMLKFDEVMEEVCHDKTADNYTMYLLGLST